MEKLLPRSLHPISQDVAPLLVKEQEKEDRFSKAQQPIYNPPLTENSATQQHSCTAEQTDIITAGDRLFVFRDPPDSGDHGDVLKRKRKRNFLNLKKKSSVAPSELA